ncbi:hypothetical protein HMPREF3156_01300 [Neisseria sp. HMSC06F02]|nr:hypothetical protein HMPREF3156_01300 [Neisseria sp. HMSC06F02]
MRHAFDGEFFQSSENGFHIQAGRGDDGFAQGFAIVELGVQIGIVAGDDFADEGIAVGMGAVGSQPQHDVARFDAAAVDDALFFDHADGKARQVVFAFGVHAGHFGGFAADEGAAGFFAALGDAFNHVGSAGDVEFAAGEIVEKEQRFCALNQNIVDAHGDEVDADGVVFVPIEGEFELGAYAVGAADEDGIFVFFADFDQCAEAAQITQHFGTHGAFGKRFDVFDQLVACVNIDACIAVAE